VLSVETGKVATPVEPVVEEPNVVLLVRSRKTMVLPDGIPWVCAVSVTVWPGVEGFGAELKVIAGGT